MNLKKDSRCKIKIWGEQGGSLDTYNYSPVLRKILQAFKGLNGNLLDVGCGGGVLTVMMQERLPDLKITGCDISEACVKSASASFPGISFVQLDITEKLPFPDNHFAGVIAHHVLEHVTDPERAMAEIYRVLNRGGVFFSETPMEGSCWTLVSYLRLIPWFDRNRILYLGHLQKFSRQSLMRLFNKAGFTVSAFSWSGYLLYQILDSIFYPILAILKLPSTFLLEREIAKNQATHLKILGLWIKQVVYNIFGIEDRILRKLPGFVIEIVAVKKRE